MKEQMLLMVAMKALKYGLKQLKPFMDEYAFKDVVKLVLTSANNFFDEGDWKDVATETITAPLATYFDVVL